jgi:hypothetical protein
MKAFSCGGIPIQGFTRKIGANIVAASAATAELIPKVNR